MLSQVEFLTAFQELINEPENAELKNLYALYNGKTMPNFEISSCNEFREKGSAFDRLEIGFMIHDVNDSDVRIYRIMDLLVKLLSGTGFDCELNKINALFLKESTNYIADIDARTREGIITFTSDVEYQGIRKI